MVQTKSKCSKLQSAFSVCYTTCETSEISEVSVLFLALHNTVVLGCGLWFEASALALWRRMSENLKKCCYACCGSDFSRDPFQDLMSNQLQIAKLMWWSEWWCKCVRHICSLGIRRLDGREPGEIIGAAADLMPGKKCDKVLIRMKQRWQGLQVMIYFCLQVFSVENNRLWQEYAVFWLNLLYI